MELSSISRRSISPEVDALWGKIASFLEMEEKNLVNRQEWGLLDFEEARSEIENAFFLAREFKSLALELLPPSGREAISIHIDRVKGVFEKVNSFSVVDLDNAKQHRDSLILDVKKKSNDFFVDCACWFSFLKARDQSSSDTLAELQAAKNRFENLLSESHGAIADRVNELDQLIQGQREAAAHEGATAFSADFEKSSQDRKVASRWWLGVTGLFFSGAVAASIYFYLNPAPSSEPGTVAQIISTKFVILGLFIMMTIWSGRVYKALMHQSEVYHHKAVTIKTLRAYIHSVDDSVIRDSIVAEGARATFGNISTGYIDQSKEVPDGSVKILEIAKSLLPGGGKD